MNFTALTRKCVGHILLVIHVRHEGKLVMLSIRLKPELEERLSRLAKETGRTKTFYASQLIEENLEDLEDRYLAEARLEKRGKRYTNAQARRQLGLDD